MITFLPTANFTQSVSMLDSKRLGNQRVEARMILRWFRNPTDYPRQQNAGYTMMWKGYEEALCLYYNVCCEEWARRGGQNIVCQPEAVSDNVKMPPWLGDDALHKTHRSALLYKLPDHYGKYGWDKEFSDPKVEYLWPRPIEGKTNVYELCPAFSKKKKKNVEATPPTTKSKMMKKAKLVSPSIKTATKKTPVNKSRSVVKRENRRYPSRRPRRSSRLATR